MKNPSVEGPSNPNPGSKGWNSPKVSLQGNPEKAPFTPTPKEGALTKRHPRSSVASREQGKPCKRVWFVADLLAILGNAPYQRLTYKGCYRQNRSDRGSNKTRKPASSKYKLNSRGCLSNRKRLTIWSAVYMTPAQGSALQTCV